jgi:tRNA-uridine 2-sulfurtransferase
MSLGRVMIAMSGGVDSSVAAAILVQQGYDVVGATMKLHEFADTGVKNERSCCDLSATDDARRVCARLEIPYYVFDMTKEFRHWVMDDFVQEYLSGRTPNPCVLCNTRMKWEALHGKAKQLEIPLLATGHYARLRTMPDGSKGLFRGQSREKDQSYALWGITQDRLNETLFPLGDMSKDEVRKLAHDLQLVVANKQESQDICFVPDGNYAGYLAQREPEAMQSLEGGEIVDGSGRLLGRHRGYPHYTIGQRRGLGIGAPKPLYVESIDYEANRLVVGEGAGLLSDGLSANRLNWLTQVPQKSFRCLAAIRYHDPGQPCLVEVNGDTLQVHFDEPQRAVTPGQSLVLYEEDRVLGGGFIQHATRKDCT